MKKFFEDRNFPPVAFGKNERETDVSFEDYVKVGEVIIGWAQDRSTWPKTVSDFLKQLQAKHSKSGYNGPDYHVTIPEAYQRFSITQAGDGKVGSFPPDQQNPKKHVKQSEKEAYVELKGSIAGPEFMLRLPPAGQVTESEDRTQDGKVVPGSYAIPPLYTDFLFHNPVERRVADSDRFAARVADYTMRSCR